MKGNTGSSIMKGNTGSSIIIKKSSIPSSIRRNMSGRSRVHVKTIGHHHYHYQYYYHYHYHYYQSR